jgi:poly(3-hydroxybutyrate) depolymerase
MTSRIRVLSAAVAASLAVSCSEGKPKEWLPGASGADAGPLQIDTAGALTDSGTRVDAGLVVGPGSIPTFDAGPATGIALPASDAGNRPDAPPAFDASSMAGVQSDAAQADATIAPPSCQGKSGPQAGESSGTLQFGGGSRSFRIYVPSNYKPDTPVPLVLWFHGILGSGQDYRSSGFREVADREGFILVAPDGIDGAWNIGPCCTARRRNVDDVGFAKAVVSQLTQKACIDPTRVYATGFSMGGGLSHYLACHAADVFAATAPSAFDLLQENVMDCKPPRAIPVASFRNSFDTFVYYDGVSNSQPPNTSVTGDTSVRINILGAEATFAAWAQIDGCSGAPEDDGAECKTYKQCRDGVEVTLCTEFDPIGGHHPGPADQMWAHLKRYRLR